MGDHGLGQRKRLGGRERRRAFGKPGEIGLRQLARLQRGGKGRAGQGNRGLGREQRIAVYQQAFCRGADFNQLGR